MSTPTALPCVAHLAQFARDAVSAWRHQTEVAEAPDSDDGSGLLAAFRMSLTTAAAMTQEGTAEAGPGTEVLESRQSTVRAWMTEPPEPLVPLAELAALFRLTVDDIEILVMAAAPAIDPGVDDLYSFVRNNLHRPYHDLGFLCRLLALGDPWAYERLLARCRPEAPLRAHRLLLVESRRKGDESLDLNLGMRRARVADRVLDFLRRHDVETDTLAVDEELAAVCVRRRDEIPVEALGLPDFGRDGLLQLARSRSLPAILEGPPGAGKDRVALCLAGLLGKGLLSADLTALLTESPTVLEMRLAELVREARLGGDLIYLQGHSLPEQIGSPWRLVLERALGREPCLLGVDRMQTWVVTLTAGWPTVQVPLPSVERRIELWSSAFLNERRGPDEDAIGVIARRYEMSAARIQQAASEARRIAQLARRSRIAVSDLDRACRAHFAHQLSDVADLVPPAAWSQDDLILPDSEKEKFGEVLLYAREQEAIYGEWGFSEKFPYGRGLSVLFYGPPGTGKTMGAVIIAATLGLDLFRVDLSRIMSRYVGETEKNLSRVFDEAERGKVMLLFDEADALFTKRTNVKSSVDRYANLEVAYLLQRMENFEGVTVLTTNVEANLDDAFKRRIRYRIYFPMPDAPTRARLWESLIPAAAPVEENIPWKLLGKHFEITGGHIKQAVLRAGFYARRDGDPMSFHHLVEGAKAECREIGMLVSDDPPKAIQKALAARGR